MSDCDSATPGAGVAMPSMDKLEEAAVKTTEKLCIELKAHQKLAVDWMIAREKEKNGRGGILADEQGTGKTIVTIGLLCANQAPKGEPKTTLIVCTNKTLVEQWEQEFRKRLNRSYRMNILIHHGTKQAQRVSEFKTKDVVITTYGMLTTALPKIEKKSPMYKKQWIQPRRAEGVLLKHQWFRVVLDEAHGIRNEQTDKWKAANRLKAYTRWCLSGTPIHNDVSDLYSLFKFLKYNVPFFKNPDCNEWTRKRFQKYVDAILLRRTKEEAGLDLPPCNQSKVERELPADSNEKIVYKEVLTSFVSDFNQCFISGQIKSQAQNLMVRILRMRQACAHPFLAKQMPELTKLYDEVLNGRYRFSNTKDSVLAKQMKDMKSGLSLRKLVLSLSTEASENDEDRHSMQRLGKELKDSIMQPSTKIEMLLEKLQECNENDPSTKSLVFSQWTSFLDIIKFHMDFAGYKTCRLDGSMSNSLRSKELARFKSDDVDALLISLHAGAEGLNITEASNVFLLDSWWNPQVEEQAIARAHRLGQKRTVQVFRLFIKNSIETRVQEISTRKRSLIANVFRSGPQVSNARNIALDDVMCLARTAAEEVLKNGGEVSTVNAAENILKNVSVSPKHSQSTHIAESKNPRDTTDERLLQLSAEESRRYEELMDLPIGAKVLVECANICLRRDDFRRLLPDSWLCDNIMSSFIELLNKRNNEFFSASMSSSENVRFLSARNSDDDTTNLFLRPRPNTFIFSTQFFTRLTSGLKGYCYESVQRWTRRAKDFIFNFDLILIPVNIKQKHYVLVSIDLRSREFVYCDPMHGRDVLSSLKKIRRWLIQEVGAKEGAKRVAEMKFDTWNDVLNPEYIPQQSDESSCGVFVLYIADYLSCGRVPSFSQDNIGILRKRTALFLDQNRVADHVANRTSEEHDVAEHPSRQGIIEQQNDNQKLLLSIGENAEGAQDATGLRFDPSESENITLENTPRKPAEISSKKENAYHASRQLPTEQKQDNRKPAVGVREKGADSLNAASSRLNPLESEQMGLETSRKKPSETSMERENVEPTSRYGDIEQQQNCQKPVFNNLEKAEGSQDATASQALPSESKRMPLEDTQRKPDEISAEKELLSRQRSIEKNQDPQKALSGVHENSEDILATAGSQKEPSNSKSLPLQDIQRNTAGSSAPSLSESQERKAASDIRPSESSESSLDSIHSDIKHSENVLADESEAFYEELKYDLPFEGWLFEGRNSNTRSVVDENSLSISPQTKISELKGSEVTTLHGLIELSKHTSPTFLNACTKGEGVSNRLVSDTLEDFDQPAYPPNPQSQNAEIISAPVEKNTATKVGQASSPLCALNDGNAKNTRNNVQKISETLKSVNCDKLLEAEERAAEGSTEADASFPVQEISIKVPGAPNCRRGFKRCPNPICNSEVHAALASCTKCKYEFRPRKESRNASGSRGKKLCLECKEENPTARLCCRKCGFSFRTSARNRISAIMKSSDEQIQPLLLPSNDNVRSQGKSSIPAKRNMPQELVQRKKSKISEMKKFVCSICGISFNKSSNFKRHFISMHSDVSYKCNECDLSFKRKDYLKTHTDSVHKKIRSYQCSACGERFNQSSHRNRHFRTVHATKSQPSTHDSSKELMKYPSSNNDTSKISIRLLLND